MGNKIKTMSTMNLMLGIPMLHIFVNTYLMKKTIYREYLTDNLKTKRGKVLQFQRVSNGEILVLHKPLKE